MAGMTAWFASESETNAQFGGDDDVVQMSLAGIVFCAACGRRRRRVAHHRRVRDQDAPNDADRDPGRLRVLVAKALILVAVMLPLGVASSAVAFAIAQPLLHDGGYVSPRLSSRLAHRPGGDPGGRHRDGPPATAYALLALGVGTILRHSGATIATGAGPLFLPFLFLGAFPSSES